MNKSKPLDDLEMHDLLRLIYPDHIRDDEDHYFELSQEACDATIGLGDGFEVTLADFLGRVVMLTMPMSSGLTNRLSHCLGKVTVTGESAQMTAAVRRDAEIGRQMP
jgi:hypothetical protein